MSEPENAPARESEEHTAGDTDARISVEDDRAGRTSTWHPRARRIAGESAGSHVGGGPKITHHTTEGSNARGAIAAYRQHGGWPHFTAEWNGRSLELIQHLPLELAARTLKNPPDGWETNRARTTQIEHVGFARQTDDWPVAHYRAIADLCRWIEARTGTPRAVTRGVSFSRPRRLSGRAFHERTGHNGHVHVPGNDHTDPGTGFRIALVLDVPSAPHRNFTSGVSGPDVEAFQRAVNLRAQRCGRPDRTVTVDGVVGPRTLDHGAWAAYILGIGESQREIRRGGIGAEVQRLVRDPDARNEIQKERAGPRRRRHCRSA